jgi:4-hydroxymandelate oxidase
MPDHPPILTTIPHEIAAVADYERYARARLDDNAWTYLVAGAADELTLADNRAAFDRLRLAPRALTDVRGGHTRVMLFGQEYEHPLMLAPVAYQRLFHPEGEVAAAQGAAALNAPMVVSLLSTTPVEAIAAAAPAPLWFQLYLQADRGFTRTLVQRAEAAGCQALVVTVDAPVAGVRNREQRARFQLPAGMEAVHLHDQPLLPPPTQHTGDHLVFDRLMAHAPTWQDLEWLKSQTPLPVLAKGIVSASDALRAVDAGLDGLIVSNHGGRVLDTLPATVDALPAIAQAVAGRLPVLLDGGVRRGTDVFKAIALGASAVLIGRPYVHALATAGALGVAHVLKTLKEELEVTMALCGCAQLADIGADRLFGHLP